MKSDNDKAHVQVIKGLKAMKRRARRRAEPVCSVNVQIVRTEGPPFAREVERWLNQGFSVIAIIPTQICFWTYLSQPNTPADGRTTGQKGKHVG